MDCRVALGLAVGLLSGAVGCQHQVATLPEPSRLSTPTPAAEPPPDPSQIKKASSLPRKDPPVLALVKLGDFKAGEAFTQGISPERQQAMRDEARQEYQRALSIDPKCLPAYQGLARLYTAMQDHSRAVETYQKALQVAPTNTALWYELGMNHNYEKEWDRALECLGRATQLEPDNRDYMNTLGVVLARVGRFQEGLECFVRTSGDAMGHYRMARTLQHLQQPELSRQYLDLALQKDPNLATAQAMRGEIDGAPEPTIQRTAYQEPSAPPPPEAPPAPPESAVLPEPSAPLPRIIQPNAPEAASPAEPEERSTLQTIVVPPPPTINLQYEAPADTKQPKP